MAKRTVVVAKNESSATKTNEPSVRLNNKLSWSNKSLERKHSLLAVAIILGIVLAVMLLGLYLMKDEAISPDTPENSNLSGAALDASEREKLINAGNEATIYDYLILGNFYKDQGDLSKAEENYLKAASLDEDNTDAQYGLATIYRLQKNKDKSLEYYDKVILAASKKSSPYRKNLALYKTERTAVSAGDFNLENIEETNDIPL